VGGHDAYVSPMFTFSSPSSLLLSAPCPPSPSPPSRTESSGSNVLNTALISSAYTRAALHLPFPLPPSHLHLRPTLVRLAPNFPHPLARVTNAWYHLGLRASGVGLRPPPSARLPGPLPPLAPPPAIPAPAPPIVVNAAVPAFRTPSFQPPAAHSRPRGCTACTRLPSFPLCVCSRLSPLSRSPHCAFCATLVCFTPGSIPRTLLLAARSAT
jgi:hypothetical protein